MDLWYDLMIEELIGLTDERTTARRRVKPETMQETGPESWAEDEESGGILPRG